ncbi:unnamed protein product [Notodromas monacha]|uniref:Uncharacterized protein n=1 Tax=Notodromas monacha TaxID=399045 RepID=A0A7R9BZD6_9CRUS|nr:unnamed protein product [Notodromas monacha]CAG0924602.1 unnamed protein product [Notodromas monacha]
MCSSVSLVYHVSMILAFLMMIVKHVFAGEPVIRYQTAAAGVILSPLYPDSEYPPSLNVEWRFRLFPGDTFELDLDRLSPHGLSKAEGDTDRVELVLESGARREVVTLMHAGPEPNKNLSDHIANGGAWFNKTAIGAQEARVTLRFHSDSSGSGVGFRAHYRISCTNASAQCLNGGTCEPQRTYDPFQADVRQEEPLCHCPDQFTGERCETYLPCYELACEPGATCHSDLAAGTVSCRCVRDGYMDLQGRCVDVDECSLSLNSPPSAGKPE